MEQRGKKAVEHAYRYETIGYEAMCLSLTSCVQSNVTDTGTTRTVADISKESEAHIYIYRVLLAISFWESSSEAAILIL